MGNYPGGVTEDNPVDTRSCWQPRGSADKQPSTTPRSASRCSPGATSCARVTPRRRSTTSCTSTAPCSASGWLLGHRDLPGELSGLSSAWKGAALLDVILTSPHLIHQK